MEHAGMGYLEPLQRYLVTFDTPQGLKERYYIVEGVDAAYKVAECVVTLYGWRIKSVCEAQETQTRS